MMLLMTLADLTIATQKSILRIWLASLLIIHIPQIHQNVCLNMTVVPVLTRGFLDSDFTSSEVTKMLSSLNNGKANGWDMIPNEALKNLPTDMIDLITILFNRIKSSGSLPKDWNRGRVTLVHKYGQRKLLSNYRPITVVISLCGLYSKLLNARLMQVVEMHNLLGEIQNGFRPDRSAADNNFILGTIRWKAKAKRAKVHAAYIDISKAYDTVNHQVLWKR